MLRSLIVFGLIAVAAISGFAQERRSYKEAESVIRGLQQGMQALRKIGGQERLIHHMEELVLRVRKELATGAEGTARRRETREENRELAAFKRQLRVKVWALEAIARTDRKKAADLMRAAVDADKARAAGRRDAEARRLYEHAPDRGAQIELLTWAAQLYEEKGDERRAHACQEVAAAYRKRWERNRARERGRDAELEREATRVQRERDERDANDGRRGSLMERIQKLEARVKRLERALERQGEHDRGRGRDERERPQRETNRPGSDRRVRDARLRERTDVVPPRPRRQVSGWTLAVGDHGPRIID